MQHSQSISAIAEALAKAQGELRNPPRNRTVQVKSERGSYTFAYATLDAILDIARPALSKHQLALVQALRLDGGAPVMVTRLIHASGEWIEHAVPILVSPTAKPQELGSAITYARRYGLSALLGLAAEEDDDGNAASGNVVVAQQARQPKNDSEDLKAMRELWERAKARDPKAAYDAIVKACGGRVASLESIPAEHRQAVRAALQGLLGEEEK